MWAMVAGSAKQTSPPLMIWSRWASTCRRDLPLPPGASEKRSISMAAQAAALKSRCRMDVVSRRNSRSGRCPFSLLLLPPLAHTGTAYHQQG